MKDTNTQTLVNEGLATVQQAAQFLGVSRGKLYAIMERGELRYCKLGKNRRIPWAAVKALAAGALVGAGD